MKEIISKIDKKEMILILILIIFAIIISFQLFFNPFSYNFSVIDRDSQNYIYIGESMHNGQIPYKDIFDHKGPFLYLINYVGTFFNSTIILWIIETFFIVISTIFVYKISKKIIGSKKISVLISILIMTTISNCIYSGNCVEEYALPFILISLYLYIKSYMDNENLVKIIKKSSLIIGMCCGATLMLRINMVVLWLVYSISIFIELIRKDRKALLSYIINFIIGNLIVIVPFCIYLIINEAFVDFIYQYIIFNFKYIAAEGTSIKESFEYFFTVSPVMIFSLLLYLLKFNNNKLKIINFIFMIMSLIIVITPGRNYTHYALILIPTYIFPICNLYNYMSRKKIGVLFFVIIAFIIFINDLSYTIIKIININSKTYSVENYDEIVDYINKEKKDDDQIMTIGNWSNFYLLTDINSCSKYIYQFPIGYIDNKIIINTINDIKIKNPRFIIKRFNTEDENIEKKFEFLENSNKYKKICEGVYVLYEKIN